MKKINIGDWVTQYRTGYWKVKELHPKYSPFDCDRLHKGEPIGVEVCYRKLSTIHSNLTWKCPHVICRCANM